MLLLIAYLSFIALGLPDGVLGVAWPSLRANFGLTQDNLGAVLVSFGVGYFISGALTGRLLRRWGVGALLAVSSALMVVSLAGYATTPVWPLFVAGALLGGLGSGAIDASLNAYGAHHFSPRHMNWLHACYGVGAMLGPLVMTTVLAQGASWRWGYALIGALLLELTLVFVYTRRRWQQDQPATGVSAFATAVRAPSVLRQPLVWLQLGIFFLYTGLEATAGQWSFTLYTEARAVAMEAAGFWVAVYWASLAAGRFLFGFVVSWLGTEALLRLSLLGAAAGALLFAVHAHAAVSFFGLALIGLSLAPVYPCLMADTPRRLGPGYALHAIGFQVSAAMLGAAAIPTLAGVLAERFTLAAIEWAVIALALALGLLHEVLLRRSLRAAGVERFH